MVYVGTLEKWIVIMNFTCFTFYVHNLFSRFVFTCSVFRTSPFLPRTTFTFFINFVKSWIWTWMFSHIFINCRIKQVENYIYLCQNCLGLLPSISSFKWKSYVTFQRVSCAIFFSLSHYERQNAYAYTCCCIRWWGESFETRFNCELWTQTLIIACTFINENFSLSFTHDEYHTI